MGTAFRVWVKVRDYLLALRRLGRTTNLAAQAAGMGALDGRLTRLEARATELDQELGQRLGSYAVRVELDALRSQTVASGIDLTAQAGEMQRRLDETQRQLVDMQGQLSAAKRRLDLQARAYTDLSRTLRLLTIEARRRLPEALDADQVRALAQVDDPILNAFYSRFEDRFRGGWDEIKDRLRVYLPVLGRLAERVRTPLVVLDLGCGRGEWLDLVREAGHIGTGIDTNVVQLEDASRLGLKVVNADAIGYLREQRDASVNVISSMHLIEHLSFQALTDLLREALRVLAPGGLLILETPNPHNLIVGSFTFHLDPTHNKPLPLELVTVLAETIGYVDLESLDLQPDPRLSLAIGRGVDAEVATLLFGARDAALLAFRPT